MRAALANTLARSHQVTLATVAGKDREYCDRLQNSLVRGNHELLYWGVGPKLHRGDIVALYTPKSKYLPDSEHSRIRRIYFAAADSECGSYWNQHVFLNRRLDLDRAITYQELTKIVSFRHIMAAGRIRSPMAKSVAAQFLSAAGKRCSGGLTELHACARQAKAPPSLCISYSGQDWSQAQRLKLWLDAAGLSPFFVSPVGGVLPVEEVPLAGFLTGVFSTASVVICLVPPASAFSRWIELEVQTAIERARRVILVRTDPRRPWPTHSRKRSVKCYTLKPTRERDLVAMVKDELAKLAA